MARQADLLSVEDAQGRILRRFGRLPREIVPLGSAAGRVLYESVRSGIALPPFANSSMDGFALAAASTEGAPCVLPVVAAIAAGDEPTGPLPPGTAARIMTGAPVPPGADAVIPFEEVEDRGDVIALAHPVPLGSCLRAAGQDVRAGEIVVEAGTVIGAAQIALLAATGHAEIPVARRPVVSILATGDELVPPDRALRPGQIYNSNSPMLAAAVGEAGGVARETTSVADTPEALAEALRSASESDVILTSGGASVGDYDYVKDVVGQEGEVGFWRVRVRPGKPLLFGRIGSTPVIGLPGNPTSAMVTFEQFVRPAIRAMLGAPLYRPTTRAVVDETIDNRGGRRTFARVSLSFHDGVLHARLSGKQDSAMLLPLSNADGLLIVPEDREELRAGDWAAVQLWRMPSASVD